MNDELRMFVWGMVAVLAFVLGIIAAFGLLDRRRRRRRHA